MSQENMKIVRWAYEEFEARGALIAEIAAPDFVWDMSHFSGWPEQQIYEGVEGPANFSKIGLPRGTTGSLKSRRCTAPATRSSR
jgi:hypothetical protein